MFTFDCILHNHNIYFFLRRPTIVFSPGLNLVIPFSFFRCHLNIYILMIFPWQYFYLPLTLFVHFFQFFIPFESSPYFYFSFLSCYTVSSSFYNNILDYPFTYWLFANVLRWVMNPIFFFVFAYKLSASYLGSITIFLIRNIADLRFIYLNSFFPAK